MTQEQPADAAPLVAEPAPPRQRRGKAVLWALLLAAVALGIAGSSPYWLPLLGDDRLAQDEARLARLETAPRPSPAEPASLGSLRARLDALEAKAAAPPVAAAPDTAAQQAMADTAQKVSARIDALDAKIAALSAATPHGDQQDAGKLAALAELRAALAGSGPYADELAALEAMGDGEIVAAVKPLDDAAKTGIPDRALLALRFRAETGPAILAASAPAPAAEPEDFTASVLARLERLVTIRRVDGAGNPAAADVHAAQAALDAGDLDRAAQALKPLAGPEAEAARPFLAAVAARLEAERDMAELARHVIGRLGAGDQH